ncbi:MAG TPA: Rrf2 family transcriptional regulator [Chthoniobacterales bacterium]
MKLSKRGEYALRAMIDLGIAEQAGRELVRLQEIAGKENIPLTFLEQILMQLRMAGFVAAKRGKAGGYYLTRPTEEITIGQIVRLVDGPLAPLGCVSQTAYEKCSCPDEEHCGLRMLMLDVRNAIAGILDRYTLAQVVEVTLRKLRRNEMPIPFAEWLGGECAAGASANTPNPPRQKKAGTVR